MFLKVKKLNYIDKCLTYDEIRNNITHYNIYSKINKLPNKFND